LASGDIGRSHFLRVVVSDFNTFQSRRVEYAINAVHGSSKARKVAYVANKKP
jgi:hypothetical protein